MRAVCLSTPLEDPERFARSTAYFAERGLTVAFFTGLHRLTSGLSTDHLYMVDRPPGSPDEHIPYSMGPHPAHIWLGHYFIWQALKLSGDSHWLVIECDARFPDGWRARFDQALADTPRDYDLLYIGSCCCAGRAKSHVAGDIYTIHGSGPQCNHAYVVAAKAVPTLEQMRKVWAPIDIQQTSECFEYGRPLSRAVPPFAPIFPKLKVYAVLPRIVDQWNTDLPL